LAQPWLIFLDMGIGWLANRGLFGIMGAIGPERFKTSVHSTGARYR
jgi:hypothetical protein